MAVCIDEVASYVCDKLCKYPVTKDQEQLDDICESCLLQSWIEGINNKETLFIRKEDVVNAIKNDQKTTFSGYIDDELLPYIKCCYETVEEAVDNCDTYNIEDLLQTDIKKL